METPSITGQVERRIMRIGRHGEKDSKSGKLDLITPASLIEMYADALRNINQVYAVGDKPIIPEQVELFISNQIRADISGMDKIAGDLAVPLQLPITAEQLRGNPVIASVSKRKHPSLYFEENEANYDIARKMEKASPGSGLNFVNNYWLQHPDSTEHLGVPIKSFNGQMKPRALLLLQDGVKALTNGGKSLVEMVGHGPVLDPVNVVLARAGSYDVNDIESIGGALNMGGYAIVTFNHNPRSGTISDAKYERQGHSFPIDLQPIMQAPIEFRD